MISAALVTLLLVPAAPTATAEAPASPRAAYNRALDALGAHDLDAAEKGFLDARDRAGIDDELRFRAAFDLGCAYAARAESLEKEKPEDALAALRSAAAWLRDAVRERPQEADARAQQIHGTREPSVPAARGPLFLPQAILLELAFHFRQQILNGQFL